MKNVELNLKRFLEDYSKLVILGIGNDIRGDDGLGPYIINRLSNLKEDILKNTNVDESYLSHNLKKDSLSNLKELNLKNFEDVLFINGASVPENFTSPIKKFSPTHILIIDASLMNKNPGDVKIISKENILNLSVSTHSMSLNYLIKYLEKDNDFNILFIGIEPEIMDLSFNLSDSVKETCDNLITILLKLIVAS